MAPAFLLAIAFSLRAADAHVSKNDLEAIDMLKQLQTLQEGYSLTDVRADIARIQATSDSTRSMQSHSKRTSRNHAIHQRHGRRLSDTNANVTVDPLVLLQEKFGSLEIPDIALVCDTMWLLFCGTFVFFMHAGFAMLEAGTARAKNVQAILIKNLITVCMGTLGWYIIGWSLAYGGDTKTVDSWKDGTFEDCPPEENPLGCPDGYADNGFIGGHVMWVGSGFLGKGDKVNKAWAEGTIDPTSNPQPGEYMWFFQWAFCTAGASIVSGGIAERVKFPGYMFFAFCMSSFIYPVVVCSTWGYGWLETFKKAKDGSPVGGYIDFAGSGVVHLCGGIGALAGAIILGSRKGRFDPAREDEFHPHSQPLICLGTFILWFGWCGFNSGSTLAMSDSGTAMVAGHVMMNTTISAATGGCTVFLLQKAITKRFDLAALCNGILGGLVSITAGCSNVESGSALLIGALGGCVVISSSMLVKRAKIDDPVDAFSVHGACGIWGCLAAALFDFGQGTEKHHGWGGFSATSYTENDEVKYMTTADALAANTCEILFVVAWSGGLSSLLFGTLYKAGLLRVDEAHEEVGCDAKECTSPRAYNMGMEAIWSQEPEKKKETETKSVCSMTTATTTGDGSSEGSGNQGKITPDKQSQGTPESQVLDNDNGLSTSEVVLSPSDPTSTPVPDKKNEVCEAAPTPVPDKKENVKSFPAPPTPAAQTSEVPVLQAPSAAKTDAVGSHKNIFKGVHTGVQVTMEDPASFETPDMVQDEHNLTVEGEDNVKSSACTKCQVVGGCVSG